MMDLHQEYHRGIKAPSLLHIADSGRMHCGGNQEWYPSLWQRKAGCGPTVAATLCAYLAKSRPACAALYPYPLHNRAGFLSLMEDLWKFVTPGFGGSNVELFTEGIIAYAKSKNIALSCEILDVPRHKESRPAKEEVSAFFRRAFEADLPVAFQNYSNGALTNLEAWHWVTLISFDEKTLLTKMYDQGLSVDIDIPLYLETAKNAGKFVVVKESV